jgi:hypothetical protein
VPAKTTEQLFATHSQFLDASASEQEDFRNALNEVMPRIYKMGYWREMLVEHTQDASDGYVSLPQDTDSIVTGILDNSPLPTRSLWHDYKLFGTNDEDKTNMSAFIDDGYAPTYRDLDSSSQYALTLASMKDPFTSAPNVGIITIRFRENTDATTSPISLAPPSTSLGGSSYHELTFNLTDTYTYSASEGLILYGIGNDFRISEIVSISWSGMQIDHPFIIRAIYRGVSGGSSTTDSTKDLLLADVNTTHGVSRYRRFRVGGTDSTSTAHMLLKRKWVDVDSGSDLVHMPSNAILKHALLGKLSEDNADIQRAQFHWGTVAQLLETDTDSYRGAAKPTLHIAPDGVGAGMSGMY